MRYTIKYLGQRKEGERIRIKLNKKDVYLKLINENLTEINLKIENGKSELLIPVEGIWILKCIENKVKNSFNSNLEISIY